MSSAAFTVFLDTSTKILDGIVNENTADNSKRNMLLGAELKAELAFLFQNHNGSGNFLKYMLMLSYRNLIVPCCLIAIIQAMDDINNISTISEGLNLLPQARQTHAMTKLREVTEDRVRSLTDGDAAPVYQPAAFTPKPAPPVYQGAAYTPKPAPAVYQPAAFQQQQLVRVAPYSAGFPQQPVKAAAMDLWGNPVNEDMYTAGGGGYGGGYGGLTTQQLEQMLRMSKAREESAGSAQTAAQMANFQESTVTAYKNLRDELFTTMTANKLETDERLSKADIKADMAITAADKATAEANQAKETTAEVLCKTNRLDDTMKEFVKGNAEFVRGNAETNAQNSTLFERMMAMNERMEARANEALAISKANEAKAEEALRASYEAKSGSAAAQKTASSALAAQAKLKLTSKETRDRLAKLAKAKAVIAELGSEDVLDDMQAGAGAKRLRSEDTADVYVGITNDIPTADDVDQFQGGMPPPWTVKMAGPSRGGGRGAKSTGRGGKGGK